MRNGGSSRRPSHDDDHASARNGRDGDGEGGRHSRQERSRSSERAVSRALRDRDEGKRTQSPPRHNGHRTNGRAEPGRAAAKPYSRRSPAPRRPSPVPRRPSPVPRRPQRSQGGERGRWPPEEGRKRRRSPSYSPVRCVKPFRFASYTCCLSSVVHAALRESHTPRLTASFLQCTCGVQELRICRRRQRKPERDDPRAADEQRKRQAAFRDPPAPAAAPAGNPIDIGEFDRAVVCAMHLLCCTFQCWQDVFAKYARFMQRLVSAASWRVPPKPYKRMKPNMFAGRAFRCLERHLRAVVRFVCDVQQLISGSFGRHAGCLVMRTACTLKDAAQKTRLRAEAWRPWSGIGGLVHSDSASLLVIAKAQSSVQCALTSFMAAVAWRALHMDVDRCDLGRMPGQIRPPY